MLFAAICIREAGEMGKGWEMVGQHDGYVIGTVQWAWDCVLGMPWGQCGGLVMGTAQRA